MWEIIVFSFVSLGIGILFAVPGILFGYWLNKLKIAPNRHFAVLFFSVFFVFIKEIWLLDLSELWFALIIITGTTIGINRMDIYWAIKQGK